MKHIFSSMIFTTLGFDFGQCSEVRKNSRVQNLTMQQLELGQLAQVHGGTTDGPHGNWTPSVVASSQA